MVGGSCPVLTVQSVVRLLLQRGKRGVNGEKNKIPQRKIPHPAHPGENLYL